MRHLLLSWGRCFLCLACWALLAPGLAAASAPTGNPGPAESESPLVLASSYWYDATGQAGLAQARQQAGIPFEAVLNRGYAPGVHWVRLRIAPSAKPLALRLSPPWLDEITLHDPLQPQPVTVGDRHPDTGNALPGLGLSLALPAADEARDVWLRLASTSAHRMGIEAFPLEALPRAQAQSLIGTALYGAVLLLMLLVLVAAWAVQPDRALGFFLLRHAVFSLFAISYLGLPTLMFSGRVEPAVFSGLFSFFTIASVPAGLAFDIALLSTYSPPRWLMRLLRLCLVLCLGLLVLLFLGYERLALEANVQAITVISLLIYAAAWLSKPQAAVELLMPKKALLGYYTLILGSLILGMLSILGWTRPSSSVTVPVVIVHGLISGLVMTGILFLRALRQQAANRQTRWQLLQAQQDVAHEQRRREEQSQFLHMLMHELKTPLSIVSLALGTRDNKAQNLQAAAQAVQQMKGIIDRCVQADQVGDQPLQLKEESVDLAALAMQVAALTPGLEGRLRWRFADAGVVRSDRQWVQVILANLLENAGHYGDPQQPIEVVVQAHSEGARAGVALRVRNAPGPAGWPDEAQVFNKYYRAPGAQRASGSGLGLYLSRQLARSLHGHLRYQPSDEQIEFKLWLPLTLS